jgi:pimeloyl-ACP methyl ester carboxylesterase
MPSTRHQTFIAAAVMALGLALAPAAVAAHLHYGWQKVDGVDLFYREGGPADAPTVVFLHGNPASSIQYEEVMQKLAEAPGLHVIAMDYPSFGYSGAPDRRAYAYTFDNLARTVERFLAAKGIKRYALYMQDYGVPVGFRVMQADPQAVTAIMVQNGVIHLDGFPKAQDPEGELRRHWRSRNPQLDRRRAEYVAKLGYPGPSTWDDSAELSPDAVLLMTQSEQRPGVIEARNDLWADYGSNVARYPEWQKLMRDLKRPTLVIWGSRDDFFTTPGALAYLRDAPQAEVHILDTVHFATLEDPDPVARLIGDFIVRNRPEMR